ncbi:MAG: hypothetical protein K9G11_02560 [Rickettsiaceae bacterium]|nr:hypothetical protein [Rickettsiaceae bacterium]
MSDTLKTINNAEFWLLVGFLLFVFFIYSKLRNIIVNNIVIYISQLAEEMNHAQTLLDNSIAGITLMEKKIFDLAEYEAQMFENINVFLTKLKQAKLENFTAIYTYKKLDLQQNINALKLKLDANVKARIVLELENSIKNYLQKHPISDMNFALNVANMATTHNIF